MITVNLKSKFGQTFDHLNLIWSEGKYIEFELILCWGNKICATVSQAIVFLLLQMAAYLGNHVLCLLQYGLDRILGEEKSLALLARAIDPTQSAMMTDVVKLLSAICIVGEENTYVLPSFIHTVNIAMSLLLF